MLHATIRNRLIVAALVAGVALFQLFHGYLICIGIKILYVISFIYIRVLRFRRNGHEYQLRMWE